MYLHVSGARCFITSACVGDVENHHHSAGSVACGEDYHAWFGMVGRETDTLGALRRLMACRVRFVTSNTVTSCLGSS